MIKTVAIQNYKQFSTFKLDLNNDLNILVGDNDAGKSTLLEAINIALTMRLNGRSFITELNPFLFNIAVVNEYLERLKSGKHVEPPSMYIELYFIESPEYAILKGANNLNFEDAYGIRVEVVFNNEFAEEYASYIQNPASVTGIPTEYYKVSWLGFSGNIITSRSIPFDTSYIDASTIRLQNGTESYIHNVINESLDPRERASLSLAYRNLKENFAKDPSIHNINYKLEEYRGEVTDKSLGISIDVSQKTNWETNLIPYLDSLPFSLAGKGDQHTVKMLLALESSQPDHDRIILIEEPENHLSFSTLNQLLHKIAIKCFGNQILIATHSTYVLNKLGLDRLILISKRKTARLRDLPKNTQSYFRKLSGYDTLRLVLAKSAILVEGPSDELIVQKAYLMKYGRLPIEDGIDVINVRGLSFARFLDIAQALEKPITVVTDNDADYETKVETRYSRYSKLPYVKLCYSRDNGLPTLEPQILHANSLDTLNTILGKSYGQDEEMIAFMTEHKTEWALAVFDTKCSINMPRYIQDAIEK